MKKLVFATNNKHKVHEVLAAIGSPEATKILTLSECGINQDIPENEPTLEGNARHKAQTVWKLLRGTDFADMWVFADDTGLEVAALDGAPGVHSARYSGGDSEANIDKLLHEMAGAENRTAQFRTCVVLLSPDGTEHLFEGIVEGEILTARDSGGEGFGYDSVFQPTGHPHSFASMPLEDKNAISHRGRAIAKMSTFLQQL